MNREGLAAIPAQGWSVPASGYGAGPGEPPYSREPILGSYSQCQGSKGLT